MKELSNYKVGLKRSKSRTEHLESQLEPLQSESTKLADLFIITHNEFVNLTQTPSTQMEKQYEPLKNELIKKIQLIVTEKSLLNDIRKLENKVAQLESDKELLNLHLTSEKN